jgi:hypothetical protein
MSDDKRLNGYFQKYVVDSLDEMRADVKALRNDFDTFRLETATEIAVLKERSTKKASLFGLLGGLIPGLLALVYLLVKLA